MTDINSTITELAQANEAFKEEVKNRFEQLETKGSVDPLTDDKLASIKSDLIALQTAVTDVAKKSNRVGVSEVNADEEAHRAAYGRWARKGIEGNLQDLEAKAMTTTGAGGADGGFAIPVQLATTVTQRIVELSPLRQLCDVIQVSSESVEFLHNVKGIGSGWVGEADARPATATPKLVKITPSFGEVYANPEVTQKLLDDAMFDVEAWLASEIAEEFARAEGEAFITGDGVNKPRGYLAGATAITGDATRPFGTIQHVMSGVVGKLPTDLAVYYKLMYSLKAAYRTGAVWTANDATIATLMGTTDSEGRPLWQPNLQVGQPASFIGAPIYTVQNMGDVANNALPLSYGNMRASYLIADRMDIRTLRDPFSRKPYVGFYTTKRVGGTLKDSEAVKVLKINAA